MVFAATVEIPPLCLAVCRQLFSCPLPNKKSRAVPAFSVFLLLSAGVPPRYAENIHFSLCIHIRKNLFPIGYGSCDKVLDVLGAVDTSVFGQLIELIQAHDITGCISLLEEVVMQGRELTQFVSDITWYLRNLLLVKTSDGNIEDVIDVSSDNLARLRDEAETLDSEQIMRYIRIFSELSGKIKYATQKRILIEMTLIKLCKPAMETSNDAVVARVRDIEEKLEKGAFTIAQSVVGSSGTVQPAVEVKKEIPKAIPEDIKMIVKEWSGIVSETIPPLKIYLKNARLDLGNDNQLVIVVEDGMAYDYLSNPDNLSKLQTMLSNRIEKEVAIQVQSLAQGADYEENHIDLSKIINMEIEIEEENID